MVGRAADGVRFKRETISIAFPNPYVKYAPTTVTIDCQRRRRRPVRKVDARLPRRSVSAGVAALLRLHPARWLEVRTNGADANADVELAVEMIRAIRT